ALVGLLKDACEHSRNQGAKALLDPRFRLEFAVSVIDRESRNVIETRTGSQGGSGGEKEIIASYVLTASLSYALCPDGSSRPLFGTIVLDEAFSRSSHAVAGRIIAALREFGLHAVFITPNKEMRLLRHHTRSAVVVHRRGVESSLVSLSWEALDEHHQQRIKAMHEVAH
ncbi:TPA: SbcC/MukB-like Walker B domain-containing protein, partial [Pseudomonas aeruginosa]